MKHDPARMWRDAIAFYDQGQYAPARTLLTALKALKPNHPPLLHLLAVCKFRLGDVGEGISDLQLLVEKNKNLLSARIDYATILNESGDINKSILVLREIHKDYPLDASVGLNLAITVAQAGNWEAFDDLSRQLIAQNPAPEILWMRALVCLGYRRFEEGWSYYGARWRLPLTTWNSPRRDLGLSPLAAGTRPTKPFWLWTEQGIGDEILLASVLSDARKAGFDFIFGCNPRNITLFQRRFPDLTLKDANITTRADLPGIELQMPLADLTALLRPDSASFGNQADYLLPDPGLRNSLRQRYESRQPGNLLVGISWDSGKAPRARQKSTVLTDWLPILQLPGVTFGNLQYGYTQPVLAEVRAKFGIDILHDSSVNPLGPSDPAAAQIAAMDMVITVSNTAAHIAGALGVPTLVLLPATYGLQWYWFRDTEQSPWYNSLTLLRQERPGTWHTVITAAKSRLEQFIAGRRQE